MAIIRYYKIDNCKFSLADCWHLTRNWKVLDLALAKVLRIRNDFGTYVPEPTPLEENLMDVAEFSPSSRAKIDPLVQRLTELGFHSPLCHGMKHNLFPTDVAGIALLSPDNSTIAKIIYVHLTHGQNVIERATLGFVSLLSNQKFLATGTAQTGFAPAPRIIPNYLKTDDVAEKWRSHQVKLAQIPGTPPTPILNSGDYLRICGDYENYGEIYRINRGVYVEMTPEEVELVLNAQGRSTKTNVDSATTLPAGSPGPTLPGAAPAPLGMSEATARVQVEIAKAQDPKESWKANTWLLVVSALLFVASFKSGLTWEFMGMLVLILLIHESGHYAAMKFFKYSNVRMFFLPFFGAAVSGKHFSVAAWKKAVVSLMGPLPGIIIAAGLMLAGIRQELPDVARLAILSLILNGLNLLPLLPMDGGWFWHALVFSRNKWIESIFRIFAGLGLMLGSIYFLDGSVILPIVGVITMIGAHRTFKIAKITAELQTEGKVAGLSDGKVPAWFTEEVIGRINLNFPKARMNAKQLAQVVLDVYERLASPRATALQVCLLGLVYFGALALALAVLLLPFIARALVELE